MVFTSVGAVRGTVWGPDQRLFSKHTGLVDFDVHSVPQTQAVLAVISWGSVARVLLLPVNTHTARHGSFSDSMTTLILPLWNHLP